MLINPATLDQDDHENIRCVVFCNFATFVHHKLSIEGYASSGNTTRLIHLGKVDVERHQIPWTGTLVCGSNYVYVNK